MPFKLIQSDSDGVTHDVSDFTTIDDVLHALSHHENWAALSSLSNDIKKWADSATPNDIFYTDGIAIVVLADAADSTGGLDVDECLYCHSQELSKGNLTEADGGFVEREVTCPKCNAKWMDIYLPAYHAVINKGDYLSRN